MRFYFEPPGKDLIKPAWGHGRYLDAWSIVHTLTGLLLGTIGAGLGLPLWQCLLATLVVAVLYEGVEMAVGIIENLANAVTDVLLAILGAAVAWLVLIGRDVATLVWVFVPLALINAALVAIGWHRHLRRLLRDRKDPA
ncbi:MAG: hypothetical protein IT535_02190 [Bauldia sp.]|nr:hypothetical protein [Bauldia sp.]